MVSKVAVGALSKLYKKHLQAQNGVLLGYRRCAQMASVFTQNYLKKKLLKRVKTVKGFINTDLSLSFKVRKIS